MIPPECVDELLILGLVDWVQAVEVASVARTIGGAESEDMVRDLSLRIIRHLLEDDLMEVGMVTELDGFIPWGIPIEDAMHRIESEWRAKTRGPSLGEICWFDLSEKGQTRAQLLSSTRDHRES